MGLNPDINYARSIKLRGHLYSLEKPQIMAIANYTPDSFYAGSRGHLPKGSDFLILDLGGCSTRPGSEPACEEDELTRLRTGLAAAQRELPNTLISIDTFRPSVIRTLSKEYTIDVVNDISGGNDEMYDTVAELGMAYVLTYPEGGFSSDMLLYFSQRLDALCRRGVTDIMLDPGFGFGKTAEQNWEIARNLHVLQEMGYPILVGISRKSMIRNLVGVSTEEALNGTTALHAFLLDKGAHLLRVHDVEEARQTILIYEQTRNHVPVP